MTKKLETLVLQAAHLAGPKSTSAKIYGAFESSGNAHPGFADVYCAIDRLAKQGLLSEVPSPFLMGGRRLFSLTEAGKKTLQSAQPISINS